MDYVLEIIKQIKLKLKLVMTADKLELWIAINNLELYTEEPLIVNCNKHCTIVINLH